MGRYREQARVDALRPPGVIRIFLDAGLPPSSPTCATTPARSSGPTSISISTGSASSARADGSASSASPIGRSRRSIATFERGRSIPPHGWDACGSVGRDGSPRAGSARWSAGEVAGLASATSSIRICCATPLPTASSPPGCRRPISCAWLGGAAEAFLAARLQRGEAHHVYGERALSLLFPDSGPRGPDRRARPVTTVAPNDFTQLYLSIGGSPRTKP
jgi:hypothetical protein